MRKKLVVLLTLVFLLTMAAPALAGVNLDVNGKSFVPASPTLVKQGVTLISVDIMGRILGAEVVVKDNQLITINENGNKLEMTVGSVNAVYNGEKKVMPVAPLITNGEVMVPLRFVGESFNVRIGWRWLDQTITIQYLEKRNDMTVDEMLGKTTEALYDCNTYKMKVDMNMAMKVKAKDDKDETVKVSGRIEGAIQQKPLVMYIKQEMAPVVATDSGSPENITSEMVFNEDGFYMTMPGAGWVKMDLPGIDMNALMEQSGGQNIVKSIEQMKDSGVLMSYGNDQVKDGKEYWVINVTMGADSFKKYYESVMKQIPGLSFEAGEGVPPELSNMINDMMKNMQADIAYSTWVDKENFLTKFMDMDAKIKLNMAVPEKDQQVTRVDMDMNQKAFYTMHDFGASVKVPQISQAKTMKEFIELQVSQPAPPPAK